MTKAVFVDGASLWHMQLAMLGANGRFNLNELYYILTAEVGSSQCVRAKAVVPPARGGFAKGLRSAGFEVTLMTTRESRDDGAIIKEIEALASDRAVDEVVIVTADQDYVPSLRKLTKRGVRVYWVATRVQTDGNNVISIALEELFDRQLFTFIELSKFIDRIASDKSSIPDMQVVLDIVDPELQHIVVNEIERLKRSFPTGINYRIGHPAST